MKFEFTNGIFKHLLRVNFNAIKHWEISAKQHFNSFLTPGSEDVKLIIDDFDMKFDTDLTLDDKGYIEPEVKNLAVSFGDTKVEHSNFIIGIIWFEIWQFAVVVIEQTIGFLGATIFSDMFGPVLDTLLNDYKMSFRLTSPFYG